MLNRLPFGKLETPNQASMCCKPGPMSDGPDRYNRDFEEDLHLALDLVLQLKEAVDKLHPRVADVVQGWLQN